MKKRLGYSVKQKEIGFSFENVIEGSDTLKDMNDFNPDRNYYKQYFDEKTAPARETVEVSGLPKNAKIEISVIAKIKN